MIILAYIYFIFYFIFIRKAKKELGQESYAKYKCVSPVLPTLVCPVSLCARTYRML